MDKDTVDVRHPQYDAAFKLRTVFSDVCKGTDVLRDKGEDYLPKFPKEEQSSWNFRKDTATLLNVTKRTVDTLCGLVFQKELTLDDNAPAVLVGNETTDGLIENIDNKGNHINVFARDLFEDSFNGYTAILVDAPSAKASDLAEQQALGLRPYFVTYCADDIINWDYQINPISKKRELSMIVFRERNTVRTGTFKRETVTEYRHFWLDGSVNWQLWREQKDSANNVVSVIPVTQPAIIEKQTQIPVSIVGELGDKPPMMDLAFKNLEHYQTYSDYKNILHKTCVPLFYTVNLEGDPTAIGPDIWFKLGLGGEMGFAEVEGKSIERVEQALTNIEKQMAMLGLAMLDSNRRQGAEVTATEMQFNSIQETSSLQVRANQLKDALEQALGFMCDYLGEKADVSVTLGATWAELMIDAQTLTALSNLVDMGQMSLKSFLWYLEKGDYLPEDVKADDELQQIQDEEKEAAKTQPVINALKMPNETQTVPPTISNTGGGQQGAGAGA